MKAKKVCVTIILAFCFIALFVMPEMKEKLLDGTQIWYKKIYPVLFPVMILSSLFCFQAKQLCIPPRWVILICGFLFGIPIGAQLIAEYGKENGYLSKKEAKQLFTFCNQLSPVFVIQFAFPICQIKNIPLAILGFYGIPFLLCCIGLKRTSTVMPSNTFHGNSLTRELYQAVTKAIQSILFVGACIAICSALTVLLKLIPMGHYLMPFLEITSGLSNSILSPILGIFACSFGGVCISLQAFFTIHEINIGILVKQYLLIKSVTAGLVTLYFFLLRRLLFL